MAAGALCLGQLVSGAVGVCDCVCPDHYDCHCGLGHSLQVLTNPKPHLALNPGVIDNAM